MIFAKKYVFLSSLKTNYALLNDCNIFIYYQSMKRYQLFLTIAVCLLGKTTVSAQPYDFQNTKLKDDKRVELLMRSLIVSSRKANVNPEDYEARSNIMWTATWALTPHHS